MFRRTLARLSSRLALVQGDTNARLLDTTICEQLEAMAAVHMDERLFSFCEQGIEKTWQGFLEDVNKIAAGLVGMGYMPGETNGVWLPNYYEWVLMQFACHKVNVVLVSVNPAYRAQELKYALNSVHCKGLLITDSYKTSDYFNILSMLVPDLSTCSTDINSEALPTLRHVFTVDHAKSLPSCIKMCDVVTDTTTASFQRHLAAHAPVPTDIANIQFTSGTTGPPKPAALTHHNILNNGNFVGQRLGYTEKDIINIPVPLYHCFGTVLGVLAGMTSGASMVFPSPGFDPKHTVDAVKKYSCTSLYGVPTMFSHVLEHVKKVPESKQESPTLRTGIMAGSSCPPELMRQVASVLGMTDVQVCYGMTETSPVSFQTPLGCEDMILKCETVGTIHPHVTCKVIGDDGETVKRGEVGELCTKGYSVMKGYYNMDDSTAEVIDSEGYMRTGDLATIDENGYSRIVGRKKDVIIRGGENIYPVEVEAFLHTHPGLLEIAVAGVPHDILGEEVALYATLKDPSQPFTLQTLKAFCHNQIAHYKIPSKVFIIDAMPLTATGKIKKYELRNCVQQ
eukprot:TRINITY_DN9078_c0_g1_i2.p1 TRINITY_DN9078_c0_g1~~TRINITY_DN9078_c0_g1_i2.p1  ORF type:complete len:566 (+),score=74.30 TRINITY_DN9078_c0_g1_i2:44-1741(+)